MKRTVLGQAVGQAAMFAALPFLSRIYPAATIGLFQVAMAVGLVCTLLATQRFEVWIVAARRSVVQEMVRRAVVGVVTVSGLVGLVGVALTAWGEDGRVAFTAAVLVGPLALQNVDNAVRLRAKSLKVVAYRNAIFGLLTAVLQVVGGLMHPSLATLVGSVVAARLIAVASTSRRGELHEEGGVAEIPNAYARASNLAAGLLGSLSGSAMAILALAFFGPTSAGWLALAQRLGTAPLTLVGNGIAQASGSVVGAKIREGGDVGGTVSGLVRRLVVPAVGLSIVMLVGGWLLYVPLLGSAWESSRALFMAFAAVSGLQVMSSSMTNIFPLLMRQTSHLVVETLKVLSLVVTFVVAEVASLGLTTTVWIAVLIQAIGYLVILVLVVRYSKVWRAA